MRSHAWLSAAAMCLLLAMPAVVLRSEVAEGSQDALGIETPSALPWATLLTPYAEALVASGGAPPYSWTVTAGALPPGISLGADGVLSGTPQSPGAFAFVAKVQDSAGASAAKSFSLVVAMPPSPVLNLTGLQDSVSAAEQLTFDIQLSSAYPLDIDGAVTLAFEPDAVNPCDDPAVQFANGARTLHFTVPAGQLNAVWESAPVLQTGTVAGKIRLRLSYSASGINLTPIVPPSRTLTLSRAAPVIQSVTVIRGGGGFQVVVTAYATPRQVTVAKFEFEVAAGAESKTISIPVSVENAFNTWYKSETSTVFGSAFVYTQPFTVQGDISSIRSVAVTLSNANGSSSSVSASF